MNRRGFLWAVGAAGWWLLLPRPVAGAERRRQNAEELLRQAIAGHQLLRFDYRGLAREVEPHGLGLITDNRLALLAWQIRGESRSGPPPGWRTFVVAEIRRLRVLKKKFSPRPEFQFKESGLREI